MSDDEQATRASGSVPHHFGTALAWRWAPELPRPLTGGFLTVLYTLRAMANSDGRLCFKNGKPITIQQIAKACRTEEKDVRHYLEAAQQAGVVVVDLRGRKQTRGHAVLYVIVIPPRVDWAAAADVVKAWQKLKADQRAARSARRAAGAGSGDCHLNSVGASSGDSHPNSARSSSGDSHLTEFGGQSPDEFGGQSPDQPGVTMSLSMGGADVCSQPQVVAAPVANKIIEIHGQNHHADDAPDDCVLCIHCRQPLIPDPRRPDRTAHARCTERHTA